MRVAFGLKVHTGWAALVVLGGSRGDPELIERRRLLLVEDGQAKQPYHAAGNLKPDAARDAIQRGVEAARRVSLLQMRAAVERVRGTGHQIAGCAVLMAAPMPQWSVDEILAVHFRMHKAEGALFRDAVARAAETCGLRLVAIPEKDLDQRAAGALPATANGVREQVARLGKSAGPPWGKDQKDAALAAMIALEAATAEPHPGGKPRAKAVR